MKTILLGYLREVLEKNNFSDLYFGYAEPLPTVSTSLNYLSRIIFPIEGEDLIVASYDGKVGTRKLQPGTILFTGKSGWAYSTRQSPYSRSVSIVFMESYIRLVYGEIIYDERLYVPWYHSSNGPRKISIGILQCLNEIMFETDSNRQAKAIPLIIALLNQVIEEVDCDIVKTMTKSERTLRTIVEYTQLNYHLPINRASVSARLNLNPCSLSRIFKEHAGQNFNAYLNELRMKKAELIVKNYDVSIERVADQCGFTSSGYFIKAFKKYFGVTPGAMRNAHR